MKVLGLTGGIASGKSTVSDYLKTKNIPIIDADELAHELTTSNKQLLNEIKARFGDGVFDDDGNLQRKELGTLVFNDPAKLRQLNIIMAPYIKAIITAKLAYWQNKGVPLVVLDAPTLYEAGYAKTVDWVMVVVVTKEQQLMRLMDRNKLSETEATNRINAQILLSEKAKLADYVVDNNQSVALTYQQVDTIIASLKV